MISWVVGSVGLTQAHPSGPVGPEWPLKENMGSGVSKITIYHPEPKNDDKKSRKYFSLGHQPGPGQPGWPSGPEWQIKGNDGLWGIKSHPFST